MDLIVENPKLALWGEHRFTCAIGRNGIIDASAKREGDGCTPRGRWPMREVFYRADRLAKPVTALPIRALDEQDGWCEVPTDKDYNRHVKLPHPGVVDERMWRDDHLYDIIVVLGYNDAPIAPGKGSAIFMHLARPDFSPSSGCVTLQLESLLVVLKGADANSCVIVSCS